MQQGKVKMRPLEEIKRILRKAGLTDGDITQAIAGIPTLQELKPIGDGEQYRAYEERYRKMMQDAGFVGGQQTTWEEYMDYVRTPAGMLALAIFNRMAEWKKAKAVP
jgi:hypothetical protein